jgi:hypothetical protein
MAQFRIDQATPGLGTTGQSRHDLVPGEVITLTAISPAGPGVTYTWEIMDKVGSGAALSATTGTSVTIGPDVSITEPCGFLIRLTADDGSGILQVEDRIASVATPNLGLRVPLFLETAPPTSRLGSNDPSRSTDNAVYADRAGLGAPGQNWRGWAEWAWMLTNALDTVTGGGANPVGSAGGDLGGTYPNPDVMRLRGVDIDAAAATPSPGDTLVFDGTNYKPVPAGGSSPQMQQDTVPPTVNNDSSEGYSVGSLWTDTTSDILWRCVDASVGNADWKRTSEREFASTAKNVFVATAGSDTTGDGSLANPYATVARALQDRVPLSRLTSAFRVRIVPPYTGPGFTYEEVSPVIAPTEGGSGWLEPVITVEANYDPGLTGLSDPRFVTNVGPVTASAATTIATMFVRYTTPAGAFTTADIGRIVRVFRAGVEVGRGTIAQIIPGATDLVFVTQARTAGPSGTWAPAASDTLYSSTYSVVLNTTTRIAAATRNPFVLAGIRIAVNGWDTGEGALLVDRGRVHLLGTQIVTTDGYTALTVRRGGELTSEYNFSYLSTGISSTEAGLLSMSGGVIDHNTASWNWPCFEVVGGTAALPGYTLKQAVSVRSGGRLRTFGFWCASYLDCNASELDFIDTGACVFGGSRTAPRGAHAIYLETSSAGSWYYSTKQFVIDVAGYDTDSYPLLGAYRSQVNSAVILNGLTGAASIWMPVVNAYAFSSIRVNAGNITSVGGPGHVRAGVEWSTFGGLPVTDVRSLSQIGSGITWNASVRPIATTDANGFMSAGDKTKLNLLSIIDGGSIQISPTLVERALLVRAATGSAALELQSGPPHDPNGPSGHLRIDAGATTGTGGTIYIGVLEAGAVDIGRAGIVTTISGSVVINGVTVPRDNLSASTNPAPGDDSADGYAVGSVWINTTAGRAYVCVNATVGNAVWNENNPGEYIFRPGGVRGGNVYTTWASLHAAVTAYTGTRRVIIDASLAAAVIPAGAWDIDGWVLLGEPTSVNPPTLAIPDGATLLLQDWARIEYLMLERTSVVSAAAITVTSLSARLELGPNGRLSAVGAGAACVRVDGGFLTVWSHDGVQILNRAFELINSATLYVNILGTAAYIDSGALRGTVGTSALFYLRTAAPGYIPTFSDYAGTFTPSSLARLQYLERVYKEFAFDEQQVGTTERHIGSVYLTEGTYIEDFTSITMLGGSAPGETGIIRLRRFTGGGLLCSFTQTGTLDSVAVASAATVPATDWYDIYIVAGDPAHTAICKGIRLSLTPSLQNGV